MVLRVAAKGGRMWPPRSFSPVKRRNKKQVSNTQQPSVSTPDIPTVEQSLTPGTSVVPGCVASGAHLGEESAVSAPVLGVSAILADIRKSLATLAVPPAVAVVHSAPQSQAVAPAIPPPVLHEQASSTSQVTTHDPTTQALLVVSQLLANINTSATPPPPTTPWTSNDVLQNSVAELKRQVEAMAVACCVTPLQAVAVGPGVSLALVALPPPTTLEKTNAAGISGNPAKGST
ncbi:hypothetical protein NDU88_001204 [Pleurodeles waltl]|uniref:Uncharacterized protein n=1 Tax=Pleurodeles waltl TaxID=8319 RepID=A0AAV7P793_PLEWA|nr:hypothetical protein NDU88_001204 [Pleurodeles waltl]